MRKFGWFLIYGGIAVNFWALIDRFDGFEVASWVGIGMMLIGGVIVPYTKKLVLEPGETVFYTGGALVGEGGVLKARSKTQMKLVLTNMGFKFGPYMGGRTEQVAIPLQNLVSGEKLSRLFVNLNFVGPNAENITMRMQFGWGHTTKFLAALVKAGVKVIDNEGVNSEGLREI